MNTRPLFGMKVAGPALLGAWFGVAPLHAAVVFAKAELYEGPGVTASDSETDEYAAHANISSSHQAAAGSRATGVLSVSAVGKLEEALPMAFNEPPTIPQPGPGKTAIATAIWEDTITNQTSHTLDYTYKFHVDNPRLGIAGKDGDLSMLAINITVDGVTMWSTVFQLDPINGLSYDHSVTSILSDDLPYSVWFDNFYVTIPLGSYAPNSDFTLRYEMTAYTTFLEANDAGSGGDGNFAAIADPFDFQGTGGTESILSAEVVPEPGALALASLSLLGLLRRRRQCA